jgi:DNA topoisomerase-3
VGAHVTCDFKSGKIILQQPVAREQMTRLLTQGKTELLENFVSNKTRRKFKAYLSFDKKEGKVMFEFEPRPAKTAAGKTVAAKTTAAKTAAGKSVPPAQTGQADSAETAATKAVASKKVAGKAVAKKAVVKRAAPKPGA